ncbi:MAG: GNAT family N-acetyltransferase [Pseudomonadota bacterium]
MFESPRLFLRKWTETDFPFVGPILGDPIVMEFSEQGALTQREQEAWFREALRSHGSSELPGVLAVEHKKTGKVLGYISLCRDLERVSGQDAEIGFRLAHTAWGQGYATEAAKRMLELAKQTASVDRVVAIVDPNNHRSVRVLEKSGMIHEGEIMFDEYDYPDHVYVWQSA